MVQTAGEYPIQGKVFGLDPKTGESKWVFNTIKDDPDSWGGDSGKYGGGGSWMPGTYDASTDTYFFGTSNPAPDYDWGENQMVLQLMEPDQVITFTLLQ